VHDHELMQVFRRDTAKDVKQSLFLASAPLIFFIHAE
jgi:hypothetical protein